MAAKDTVKPMLRWDARREIPDGGASPCGTQDLRKRSFRERIRHPTTSRFEMFAILFVFVVFWNVIVSAFVVDAIRAHAAGNGDWFKTIILIPFVAIGLVMLGIVVHLLLSLFNPKPILITQETARLGDELNVSFGLEGRHVRLRSFEITLEGIESASYQDGSSITTDTRTFFNVPVVSMGRVDGLETGGGSVVIPGDSMHSWKGVSNKITWMLRARGKIRFWPDINEEFELLVVPPTVILGTDE